MTRPRPAAFELAFLLLAAAALGLASQFEIAIEPVPITLQSLAVILVGFWLGPVRGFAATALWLVGGALGLPLFAGGEGGVDHLTGPTAGYLFAFPLAAGLAGYLGAFQNRPGILRLLLAAIAAHALILAFGGMWLAAQIGLPSALEKGVLPFIPGSLIKSAIAAATGYAAGLRRKR